MTTLNNITKISINGNEIKKVDTNFNTNIKSKDKTLISQETLEKAASTVNFDCSFDFNKQHQANILYDNMDIRTEDSITKDVTYGLTVKTSGDTFRYTEDCLTTVTTDEVYMAPVVNDETKTYIVKNNVDMLSYNYGTSATYDSYANTSNAPHLRVYLPQNTGNDVYYIPKETFVVKNSGVDKDVLIWGTTNDWEHFYTDPSCTNKFTLDTNYTYVKQISSTAGYRKSEKVYKILSDIYYKPVVSTTSTVTYMTGKNSSIDLCVNLRASASGTVYFNDSDFITTTMYKYNFVDDATRKTIYKLNDVEKIIGYVDVDITYQTDSTTSTNYVAVKLPLSTGDGCVYKLGLFYEEKNGEMESIPGDNVLYHTCSESSTEYIKGQETHAYALYGSNIPASLGNCYLDPGCTVNFKNYKATSSTEDGEINPVGVNTVAESLKAPNTYYYVTHYIRELYYKPIVGSTTQGVLLFYTINALGQNHHPNYYSKLYNETSKKFINTTRKIAQISLEPSITIISNVPDTLKKIEISPEVYVSFNCTRAEPLTVIFNKIDITQFPQTVTNGNIYVKCSYQDFGTTTGIKPSINVNELHLSNRFFDGDNLDNVAVGKYGDWSDSVTKINKLYIQTEDLYTSLSGDALKNRIADILNISSSIIYFD